MSADRANLGANRRAGVHHQRDQDVDVALHRMRERAVAGGDDDLKEIGPDGQVRRDAEHVDHRRHPNVTGPAAKKPTETPTDESDQQNDPERNRFYARGGQFDHRPNVQPLNSTRHVLEGGMVLFCF